MARDRLMSRAPWTLRSGSPDQGSLFVPMPVKNGVVASLIARVAGLLDKPDLFLV
jgi:hypothetical protein